MIVIDTLKKTGFDELFTAFNNAFADYDIQISKEELENMLERRGYNPELSFGAFDNGVLVAFTFNGTGTFNNLPTVYDTGTGTQKEYRGQGLAAKIFNFALPYLKDAAISQYLLEVLQHNTSAINVYRKLGFEVCREFNYFSQNTLAISPISKPLPSAFEIRPITLSQQKVMTEFWDFIPSWQNSFESISRKLSDFLMLGVFQKDNLIGYSISVPLSGDITQLAISQQYRRQGIGSALLQEILHRNQFPTVKALNTETNCESIISFLETYNILRKGMQFEMIKRL